MIEVTAKVQLDVSRDGFAGTALGEPSLEVGLNHPILGSGLLLRPTSSIPGLERRCLGAPSPVHAGARST